MDRACHDILSELGLPDVHLIDAKDFEEGDEELLRAKQNRTLIEYYFTLTPSLPLFILNNFPDVDFITYLDADLFFFADPAAIYDEIGADSIAIVGHRFPPHLLALEEYGIYNVGWLSFRRDKRAFDCLRWWRERCIEWCYYRADDGRFADQKYLDDWPSRFQGVVVLGHKGANLAPWNLANYKVHKDGDRVWVDEQSLIFFHFHGLKQMKDWLYDPNLADYKVKPSKIVVQSIFAPYIRTLLDVTQQFSPLLEESSPSPQYVPISDRVMEVLRLQLQVCQGILTRKYILVMNGRVI